MSTRISRFSQLRNSLISKGYRITEKDLGCLFIIHTNDADYEVSIVRQKSRDYKIEYAKSLYTQNQLQYYPACIQLITDDNSISNFVFVNSVAQIAQYIALPLEEKKYATYDTFQERKSEINSHPRND